MKIITAEEKIQELAPQNRLLTRCAEALQASSYLGAVVPMGEGDGDQDIDLASAALFAAGWNVETVAEYPPGVFTPNESGNQLRIYQRISGRKPPSAHLGGGGH